MQGGREHGQLNAVKAVGVQAFWAVKTLNTILCRLRPGTIHLSNATLNS